MTESLERQILREEAKRDRCWDPRERWRTLQDTMAWADSQQVLPRNSPQSCLSRQRQHESGVSQREHCGPQVAEKPGLYGAQ